MPIFSIIGSILECRLLLTLLHDCIRIPILAMAERPRNPRINSVLRARKPVI
jgi:hypothetical protein